MKIDIHITDATPVEAQRVLMGMNFAEEILGKISPVIRIERGKPETVPDCPCENGGCDKCSPPKKTPDLRTLPIPKKPRKSAYGIPSGLFREDKTKYQRIWTRCKKWGLTYAQALELEGMIRPGKAHVDAIKAGAVKPATVPIDTSLIIKTGDHVRQTRPDAGRMIAGNGVVTGRRGEIVEVRDGNGKTHKILAACLEIVTGPVSDRAAGASS